jgi:type II secretory pathway pseudopilin PulG
MDGLVTHLKNDKGFTLAEVLVSGVILAIGLLGIASMMAGSVRGNDFGKRLTIADSLAQQRMEEFKNLSYASGKSLLYTANGTKTVAGCGTNADGANDIDDDADDGGNEFEAFGVEDYGDIADFQDVTIRYPDYRRETLVEAANGCLNTDRTANVTVRVMWKGITGTHTVTVMSMLAR